MILKLLSIPELNLQTSWTLGWKKINKLDKLDKYMTFFWLLGPLIYLIERDPADLWLTTISIIFLARCFKRKEWSWSFQIWFKAAFALWMFGLFSAMTSPDPLFSFQQGFVWIRFPLYAAAAQAWLAKDRDIRIVMLFSILLGMLIMSGILIAETILEPKTRLTWPYGDLVPGGYMARVSLPLFCVLIAIAVSKRGYSSILASLIALLSISVSVLTGERVNFLIRACSGMLAGIVWKPKYMILFILIVIEIFAVLVVFYTRPDLTNMYGKHFFKHIPLTNMSDGNVYWGSWRGGIQQGLLTPIKGIGPSGTRKTCKNLEESQHSWLPGKNNCGNHPHHFYIQLFAETGIIGLALGCIMFGSIIISCFKARIQDHNCPMAATAFVVPLALFFPLQQFNSFYGQWANLFTWFAIAFAVSQYQGWREKRKFPE